MRMDAGSSPRTWGTPAHSGSACNRCRFIPTHVGNAGSCRPWRRGCSVHPHARGERFGDLRNRQRDSGSSPRTWGTLCESHLFIARSRFIPTHVGNASSTMLKVDSPSVHPHARGERRARWPGVCSSVGSSPRTWGTLLSDQVKVETARFIPTHVGNATRYWAELTRRPVHPHARGERGATHLGPATAVGSSPRTWGTLDQGRHGLHSDRFIPTHVGNAGTWRGSHRPRAVHPHARGERELAQQCRWPAIRFIPTHVGNALLSSP